MKNVSQLSLLKQFQGLDDPRIDRTKRHLLTDIISLAICAVIAGADGWEEIEDFGHDKFDWLKKYLRLPNGIPSHDTISRLFRRINPEAFQECFLNWTQTLHDKLGLKLVAIDGKTLRRSHDRNTARNALHLVSAWSVENHLTLGQEAVDEKSNEITAIPELLRLLELKGAIVTIDAMGCQKNIAEQIVEQGADYVLAVKDNQPTLHAALRAHFLHLHETDFADADVRHFRTRQKAHGREEERSYFLCPVPESLCDAENEWPGLRSVGQVISITQRDGKEVSDVRYYISSMPVRVKKFASAVRGHWGIENSLHWVLDVTFDEDRSRIRKDHGPENFAMLRRIATSVIKQDTTSKQSVRRARKRAGWNNENLLKTLTARH
jgi:predicted transposase YbfD/YdcC